MSFLERFSSLWGANVASRRLSSLTLVAFFVATIAILNSQTVANAQDDFNKKMKEAAKQLDFLQAAQYRDEIIRLLAQLELKT